MRYTSKLRLLILLIAILPPLIIVFVLKFSTEQKIEKNQQLKTEQSIKKAENFILSEQGRVKYNAEQLIKEERFLKLLSPEKKMQKIPNNILQLYDFDFLAIMKQSGKVVLAHNFSTDSIKNMSALQNKYLLSKTVDLQGVHAALTYMVAVDSTFFVYIGKYIDHSMTYLLGNIAQAEVSIEFDIKSKDNFQTVLMSSQYDKITILLDFDQNSDKQLYIEVVQIISIVTLSMMLFAIIVGIYLTGRTKKEIDNLRSAFADVASGNFDVTVMAYEKSEFSELADSFSEMVSKLKTTQSQLATVEKIAAWETVGRRLAHEIKNPLSPISIAADDLRSSYFEKLPNFDKTLEETTSTIKKEVRRMTTLLDEFVSFARMKQSDLRKVEFSRFIDELKRLYAKEIRENKLQITTNISKVIVNLDRDTFLQLCINLIKNGFESNENSVVDITITNNKKFIQIIIADNGPGFTEEKLTNSFMPFETTKIDGSGLGLVICHRIILDHNGTMVLQNKKDKGGKVVITLPTA